MPPIARPASPRFATMPTGAKVLILVAIVGALCPLYYVLLQVGLQDDVASAKQAHGQLEAELQALQLRQQQYLKLREEAANREALERQVLRVLPDKAEIPAFLDDLNRLAELSGLRVDSVIPQKEAPEEFYVKVPVALKLEGKFHQLAKFFYNISRLERAINMENIAIGTPREEGEDLVLAVQVLATTFRRLGPEDKL